MTPFVSFVIATIGRPSLKQTLTSLFEQEDADWEVIIAPDLGYEPDLKWVPKDPRVTGMVPPPTVAFSAGAARNAGMEVAQGEWVGFVDDDDRLHPEYVKLLRERDEDLVLFRRRHEGYTMPIDGVLKPGAVGISFAVRRSKIGDARFPVHSDVGEDWEFFNELHQRLSFHLSDRTTYYVRDTWDNPNWR